MFVYDNMFHDRKSLDRVYIGNILQWIKPEIEPDPILSGNAHFSTNPASIALATNLQSIEIPNGVSMINSNAFLNFTGLVSVYVPASCTEISNSAFSGCTSLANVFLSEGLTTIRTLAFRNCTSLKEITIPSTVTNMGGNDIFSGCTDITIIIKKAEGSLNGTPPWGATNANVVWEG